MATNFEYTMSGTITSYGCATVTIDKFYNYQFEIGSIAYDLISAELGKVEPISIQKVVFYPKGRVTEVFYRDSLNAVYSEANLVTHDEAVEIATAYLTRRLNLVNARIAALNCK